MEVFGVELPLAIEREARGHFAGLLRVSGAGNQPCVHLRSPAPCYQRSESDQPDQGAIRVVEEPFAYAIDRRHDVEIEVSRELLDGKCHDVAWPGWKRRPVHSGTVRICVGRSLTWRAGIVLSSSSSLRRWTAFSRSAAASRAMADSPACSTRGTRRSSAAISSWSSRARSCEATATDSFQHADSHAGRRSRLHRISRNASRY